MTATQNIFPSPIATDNLIISNGQSASAALNLLSTTLCGLYLPAAFTGANITFQGSYDGTNFFAVKKDGAAVSVAFAASSYIVLQPSDFAGLNQIKVVSDGTEGASRTIVAALRTI